MRLTEFTRLIICAFYNFRRLLFDEGLRSMKRWETLKLHHLAYLFQGTLITLVHLSFTSPLNVNVKLQTSLISNKFGIKVSFLLLLHLLLNDNMLNGFARYDKNIKRFVQSEDEFTALTRNIITKSGSKISCCKLTNFLSLIL